MIMPHNSSNQADGPSPTYQQVVVRGLPYERGFSHGQQAKLKVQANVAYYEQPGKLAPGYYFT
jgi:isopenicillin-N N-acyltransferase-like protein